VASTTALPPPTSIHFKAGGWPTSSAGCVYCKACAGHFICRLFLLQGLCRSDRLLAVCYEACAGHFICRLFATTALFCLAMPCPALPAALVLHLPHFCPRSLPCAPGSSRVLQGLPCRQPHHGTALAARAPCLFASIHPSIHPSFIACVSLSQRHSLCRRDCPVGSRTRRLHLCNPCTACVHCVHFKGGGLGLLVSSRPHSPSPALFHEPETACE